MSDISEAQKLTLAVMDFIGGEELCGGNIWWFNSERILINCNDMFCWACSDCEAIQSSEDLKEIVRAVEDVKAISAYENEEGLLLWICRKRGMRVQNAAYAYIPPSLWPLFDAAGPHRPAAFGNPSKHPSEMTEEELEKFQKRKDIKPFPLPATA